MDHIVIPDAAPRPQAVPRLLDAAQKARVVFELMIGPIFLGREADQHPDRSSVAGNNDLLGFGFV